MNAFTTGDADILTGITSDLVEPLQDNPDYVVNEGTTNGEFTLGFNNASDPLTDLAVRKAIRQAIDKEGIKELNNGFGTLIGGPVPPTDPWYEDLTDVVPYDPDAAKAALAEAGYADGFDLSSSTRTSTRRRSPSTSPPSCRRSGSTSTSSRSSSRCGSTRSTATATTT